MKHDRSKKLYERAVQLIPGGVNSPVRAMKSVGGEPVFMSKGEGPYIHDVDGNRYIDYVCSWGPLILGHAPKAVVEEICRVAADGTSFGWATAREVELAERVTRAVPSVERVRFVNSGTEATMSALRVARGFTGKDRVIKFAGCYHGHADAFLSESAGSGVATLGIPGSAGVPQAAAADTITVPFNDLEATEAALKKHSGTVAAIILEPVAANMGLVLPAEGFLKGLRELCDRHGALLVFDEVITGFRLALGGAQARYGVRPDLTTFGKIIGGGLPVGAYGGRKDIMDKVAPLGPVYQAGTLSGNPLAMAAGNATLEQLARPGFYEALDAQAAALTDGLRPVLEKHGLPARIDRVASIFGLWWKPKAGGAPRNYEDMKLADTARFARFFRALLPAGVAIAPSAFEVGFVSSAHQRSHIDATITAFDNALATSAAA
jgi:glutamate-1-semialdehyde 2,1-aminomutase